VRLLSNLLRRFIRQGTLRIHDADGKVHVFGNRLPGPDVTIRLHDRKLYTKLFINPELYAAEAYMDGSLTLEDGAAIHDFLWLFSVNRSGLYSYGSQKLMRRVWRGLRRWHQANPIGLAAVMRVTITTSQPNSIACSSTTRCNIPALIFAIQSMTRSNRRSATS
jgi:cyclopropane-fatty-acyl-phospholipid synthase